MLDFNIQVPTYDKRCNSKFYKQFTNSASLNLNIVKLWIIIFDFAFN